MQLTKLAMTGAVLFAVSAWGGKSAPAGEPPPPWTVETLCGIVQPMKHDLKGRLPILLWEYPLPLNEEAIKWRQDGRLRQAIDELAKRGIAIMPMFTSETGTPSVTGHLGNAAAAMAIVQTLKEAGQPVHLLNAVGFRGVQKDGKWVNSLYADAPTYKGRSPWNAKGEVDWTGETEWVAMTRYDVKPTVEMYTNWMRLFKDAGIDVAGVWTDYEGGPMPWNFAYEGAKSEAGRKYYPTNALVSFQAFESYVAELRAKILSEAIADPVHAAFPKALVGNYGDVVSSEAYPMVGGNLGPYGPSGIGRMNVMMPALYAFNAMLKRFYNMDWAVTQPDVDNIYFTILLQQTSVAGANKQPGQLFMPFMASLVIEGTDPRYCFGLSPDLYRELHRHALLRGADGFYVFTAFSAHYPGQTPADICAMVENTRAPYDELLEYREFLDHGTPMNFEVPALRTKGLVWSGLRWKDRRLVRAFTMAPTVRRLEFVPFPGVAVSVDAPPAGATYLIDRRGRVKKVGVGL